MSTIYEPARELTSEDRARLTEPRVAVVATVSPSGDPHMAPCWFLFEHDRFLTTVHTEARRARNVGARGRARILIERPGGYITAVGPARIITGPDIRARHGRICERYLTTTGQEHFLDDAGLPDDAVLEIVPDTWMTWDMASATLPITAQKGHSIDDVLGWFEPVAPRDVQGAVRE